MSKLGANVTGIDASEKNINVANFHAKKNKLKINYICSSPEKLILKKKFDIVLNMEIVEHVDDVNFFINKSSEFLKKNGLMFIATLNKTLKSYNTGFEELIPLGWGIFGWVNQYIIINIFQLRTDDIIQDTT